MAEPLLLGGEFVQDPYGLYERLRAEGPVRPAVLPRGLRVWLVTRYAEARDVLANPKLHNDIRTARAVVAGNRTVSGPTRTRMPDELVRHMLNADPPDHTRLRLLVAKAFTGRMVERLRPRIEQITEALLTGLAGHTSADLVASFAVPLPITVICELLGVPEADRADHRRWSDAFVSASGGPAVNEAARAMTEYLTRLIDRKRASPAGDLLSELIEVRDRDGDRLDAAELVSMAALLLIAGHETTVNLIGNAVLALLRNPEQLAALRADPALLTGAVEEFLRYESPVGIATMRYTTEPVRVGGVTIPGNAVVLVSLGSANRDGAQFTGAERLDITRAPTRHLAFGHGVHFCTGAPLARLEARIAIGRLLTRFPNLTLAADPRSLRWKDSLFLHGLNELPVNLG
jgi:cytochrome P450